MILRAITGYLIIYIGLVVGIGPFAPSGVEPVPSVTLAAELDPTDPRTGKRRHPRGEPGRERDIRRVLREFVATDRTRVVGSSSWHTLARDVLG
jgi:hypothetical protein